MKIFTERSGNIEIFPEPITMAWNIFSIKFIPFVNVNSLSLAEGIEDSHSLFFSIFV